MLHQHKFITLLCLFLLCICYPAVSGADLPEVAKAAARSRDYTRLAQLLEPIANKGNSEAQFQLAGLYRSGRGVDKSAESAVAWLLLAAEQGHAKAQQSLGVMYQNGWGVEASADEAEKWFAAAAEQGLQVKIEKAGQVADGKSQQEKLLWSASKGDLQQLEKQLAAGADIDSRDRHQRTSLIIAAANGDSEIVARLLELGANINLRDSYGDDPLLVAVSKESSEVVQLLLDANAEIDSRDLNGNTALIIAVGKGNLQIAKQLIAADAQLNLTNSNGMSALQLAESRELDTLSSYLKQNGARLANRQQAPTGPKLVSADVLSKVAVAGVQQKGSLNPAWSTLMTAAWLGEEETVAKLLEKGAAANELDNKGNTALSLASQRGHKAVIEQLLNAGADPLIGRSEDRSILGWLATYGFSKLAATLVAKGVTVDEADQSGNTPLFYAIENNHLAAAEVLLEKGADSRRLNQSGLSPLGIAAINGHTDMVKLLLKKGVDIESFDQRGRSPLWLAASEGKVETVRALLKLNAEKDAWDNQGQTALSVASQNGHLATVDLLLERVADPSIATNEGNTALLLAARHGHAQVVEILISNGAEIDHQNENGNTALLLAAATARDAAVKTLLDHQADTLLRNKKQQLAEDVTSSLTLQKLIQGQSKKKRTIKDFLVQHFIELQ